MITSAVAAVPFGLLGLAIGSRLRHRALGAAIRRSVLMLLVVAGTGVIERALA